MLDINSYLQTEAGVRRCCGVGLTSGGGSSGWTSALKGLKSHKITPNTRRFQEALALNEPLLLLLKRHL